MPNKTSCEETSYIKISEILINRRYFSVSRDVIIVCSPNGESGSGLFRQTRVLTPRAVFADIVGFKASTVNVPRSDPYVNSKRAGRATLFIMG